MIRPRLTMTLAALAMVASASLAIAHGDEDHGAAATPVGLSVAPRMEAATETLELVAAAKADDLTIWIDGFADNVPVTGATVSVTVDGKTGPAKAANGFYTYSDGGLENPGPHELSFLVSNDGAFESLSGTLTVPKAAADTTAAMPIWRWLLIAALVALVLAGAWHWRARRLGAAGLAVLIGALLFFGIPVGPAPVAAHGDEDHGASPGAPTGSGEAAVKTADGKLFGPKSVQRIIGVRTVLAAAGEAQPNTSLTGKIVADPKRGGLIQSATGGRIGAPASGLPIIGQAVRAGQVLGFVAPPLQAIDRADLARESSDLDQQIALAANSSARLRRLEGVVPRRQIEEAGITLAGLQRRRAALAQARSAREVLVSPIDGVIGLSNVRVGQVVSAETTLFEIVDRSRLYVEANLFDRRALAAGAKAVGKTADGTTFDLVFEGAGLIDRGRAAPALFRVVGVPANLRIGEPITIEAPLGGTVAGVIVPRAALLSSANGTPSVFVKTHAELFEQRSVKSSPVDASRVALLSNVKPGEHVVTAGAELLGQVR
ncbi:efflux RND transporter periplasmic adaptor subunit [Sphingomonas sp.]|uniref:efflux RND transporter periplasmic adaptor subunit n=1 Tax=Sphingomonas sp. TaxID=28214 RepID=UPI0035A99AAE